MVVQINKKEVISRLNMLRGLFAILIVIGHCSQRFEKEILPFFIIHKFNMVGVCFFFFVSGLSLTYNFRTRQNYLKNFIKNKVVVLFLFAVLNQVIYHILQAAILNEKLNISLSLLSEFNWYIYEMIVFYIMFYIVFRFIDKSIVRNITIFFITFLVAVITLYFYRYGKWSGWSMAYYISSFSFPFGILMSEYFESIMSRLNKHIVIYCILLVCVAAGCCVSLAFPRDSFLGGVILKNIMGICIMTVVTVMVSIVDIRKIPVVGAVILFLTGYSTEIYLYQFCWLDIIARLYERSGVEINIGYIVLVTGVTVLTAVVMRRVDGYILKYVKG